MYCWIFLALKFYMTHLPSRENTLFKKLQTLSLKKKYFFELSHEKTTLSCLQPRAQDQIIKYWDSQMPLWEGSGLPSAISLLEEEQLGWVKKVRKKDPQHRNQHPHRVTQNCWAINPTVGQTTPGQVRRGHSFTSPSLL